MLLRPAIQNIQPQEADENKVGGKSFDMPQIYNDAQLEFLIDPILKSDDVNNDGMIDYAEFIAAQVKTRKGERKTIEVSV